MCLRTISLSPRSIFSTSVGETTHVRPQKITGIEEATPVGQSDTPVGHHASEDHPDATTHSFFYETRVCVCRTAFRRHHFIIVVIVVVVCLVDRSAVECLPLGEVTWIQYVVSWQEKRGLLLRRCCCRFPRRRQGNPPDSSTGLWFLLISQPLEFLL